MKTATDELKFNQVKFLQESLNQNGLLSFVLWRDKLEIKAVPQLILKEFCKVPFRCTQASHPQLADMLITSGDPHALKFQTLRLLSR